MPSLIPSAASPRWAWLFLPHTQLVDAPRTGLGDSIDRNIATFANQINGPSREDVAEAVELGRRAAPASRSTTTTFLPSWSP
jgi:hypothetical protein